jgi:hypothetical protein
MTQLDLATTFFNALDYSMKSAISAHNTDGKVLDKTGPQMLLLFKEYAEETKCGEMVRDIPRLMKQCIQINKSKG